MPNESVTDCPVAAACPAKLYVACPVAGAEILESTSGASIPFETVILNV
jgi:hypothetical protein